MTETSEHPVHPVYGRALGGAPITIDGVTFYLFRCGVLASTRATADGALEVRQTAYSGSFIAKTKGDWLRANNQMYRNQVFRKFETAARAAIKAAGSPVSDQANHDANGKGWA